MVAGGSKQVEIFTASPAKSAAGDRSGMARLAASVPKVKLVQDQAENNRRNRIRSSLVNVIDWALKHPEMCPDLWLTISSGAVVGSSSASAGDDADGTGSASNNPFDKPSFGKVGTDDLAQWLCDLPDGPSRDMLDLVDSQDADAVRDIFTALLQLRSCDRIPMEARQDLRVAQMMLKLRLEAVGPRLPGWFRKSVNGQGQVDFSKVPIYTPVFTEGRMTSVKHISGDTATIPSHISITVDYKMLCPHDDMAAKMVKSPDEQVLARFFEAGTGPLRHALDKRTKSLQQLAEKAKRDLEAELASKQSPNKQQTGAVLHRRINEKRAAALEKARATVQNAPKRARTVEFVA